MDASLLHTYSYNCVIVCYKPFYTAYKCYLKWIPLIEKKKQNEWLSLVNVDHKEHKKSGWI